MTEYSEKNQPRITPGEARQALAAVRAVQDRARRSLSLAGGGEILMIWGLVWLVGYLANYVTSYPLAGRIWVAVDAIGLVATLVVVGRSQGRFADPLGPRIGALWLSLVVFAFLWLWAAAPLDGTQIGFLAATFAMFGYVVMGLWLDLVFLAVGLGVTAIAAAGFVWFRADFDLWMALLGGGTLLGSGLYVRRRWR